MLDIGRICVKLTGKEAGNKAVIVDIVDKNFVLVDSPWVNRRRCNIKHLEPLDKVLQISRGASSEEVEKALKEAEIEG
ncbi:50S ribosomal protein L14e [archaeon BMS3Bbin15]|nr:50S ribosomal protein L14e [archaeon BMS3Bbin15]